MNHTYNSILVVYNTVAITVTENLTFVLVVSLESSRSLHLVTGGLLGLQNAPQKPRTYFRFTENYLLYVAEN